MIIYDLTIEEKNGVVILGQFGDPEENYYQEIKISKEQIPLIVSELKKILFNKKEI